MADDVVWRNDITGLLDALPDNVRDMWRCGFTEILNNAIDHSSGQHVAVRFAKTATTTEIMIDDDGEGVFKKIQRELELYDERHAVLELAKGKLTTDPANHTGEGIFFSSRLFDDFMRLSGNVLFSHAHDEEDDWIVENQRFQSGIGVFMKLLNNFSRTSKQLFDSFTSDEDYGFTKTVVPVRLAQYGTKSLFLAHRRRGSWQEIEKLKTVIFDFDEVESIGQAFADEVFRVFELHHPDIELLYLKANESVERMIRRAQSNSMV